MPSHDVLIARVRREYREMPGLCLTFAQACRLWQVDAPTCQALLDQLLKEVPGVQLFRRSDAHSGHPTSQGVTLRALGGNASSRALLVLDGVPQSDPFGGWVNWPTYDPADLSGISIVRGGGSVANGPGSSFVRRTPDHQP